MTGFMTGLSVYFCTECGLEKYKEQVHVKYEFKLCYTTRQKNYSQDL